METEQAERVECPTADEMQKWLGVVRSALFLDLDPSPPGHGDFARWITEIRALATENADLRAQLEAPTTEVVDVAAELLQAVAKGHAGDTSIKGMVVVAQCDAVAEKLIKHDRAQSAQLAEAEGRAVREGWEPHEYMHRSGLLKVAVGKTSRGCGWCVLERGDVRGLYPSNWYHLNVTGEPFDKPQAAIAAAEAAQGDETG